MVKHIPYKKLGHADHGWLNARHHFSFASYYDESRMGFGTLRVINDDIIDGKKGFGMHPHKNMEIITYVREGAISHKDNMGNAGKTKAGDVQVMSAGTGVFHSEFNDEDKKTKLFQIWIEPNEFQVRPRWDMKEFPKTPVKDKLSLLVSGNEDDKESLFIHQDAYIYGGRMDKGTVIDQPVKHQAYVLASKGQIKIDDLILEEGDGAEVTDKKSFRIEALSDGEVLVIDTPPHGE